MKVDRMRIWNRGRLSRFVCALASFLGMASLPAGVSLPPIFSDHMVLQKGGDIPVWGSAEPGQKVVVSLDGRSAEAQADVNGRWEVRLDLRDSSPGPFEMVVEAGQKIVIQDVVIGEVWLAAGQSNMAYGLEKSTGAAAEIAASADPMLREFKVVQQASPYPATEARGKWLAASPHTAGKFSAVGYYFGKTLRRELGRPVGIINASMSSTPIESWMSGEALDGDAELKATKDRHWAMREGAVPEGVRKPIPSHLAASLFHGMLHPLIPYGIRGFLWNQGEANAKRGWQYRTAFVQMIGDWRRKWGRGELPFYFCQTANFSAPAKSPGESDWAELRDAQASALALPATGMAVLIDTEPGGDLHPPNKKDAGERLAFLALAGDYGKSVAASGPVLRKASVERGAMRLGFDHAEGLVLRDACPSFAICGADRQWVWAEARVEGGDVVVSAHGVSEPTAVRYAWSDNPAATLFNAAGLPAAPFRTDDFPAVSLKRKY